MGIADRLGLGRSSTFGATVIIHELAQVPLVNAKFKIKWKFKGATSGSIGSEQALHDAVDETTAASKRFLHPLTIPSSRPSRSPARSTSPPRRYNSRDSTEDSSGRSGSPPASPPMSPSAAELRTPNPNRTPSAPSSAFAFTSPFSQSTSEQGSWSHVTTPEDSPAGSSKRRGAVDPGSHNSHLHARSEPKGTTSYIPLHNHTATFKREIHCPVSISLKALPGGRYQLQPSSVKLSVRQEITGDEGKKEEVRTGEVILDLAQFVPSLGKNGHSGQGQARRYLLQDCKTNATLKVTVQMEFLGGEQNYVAPPLRTGQIKSSDTSSGFLSSSSSSVTNKSSASLTSRSKASSNGRLSNASSVSLQRTASSSSMSTSSAPSPSSKSPSLAPNQKKGWHPSTKSSYTFSSSPSPTLGGTENDHTAVDLIETLFNRPSRTASWNSLPHTPMPGNENQTLGRDEALVFSVNASQGRGKRQTTASTIMNGKGKSKADSDSVYHDDHAGRRQHSPQRSKALAPPLAANGNTSSRVVSASQLGSGRPPTRPQQLSRRSSLSGQSTTSSRNLSVRWGDESSPPSPASINGAASNGGDNTTRMTSGPPNLALASSHAVPQSQRPASTRSNSGGILRGERSESSLDSVVSVASRNVPSGVSVRGDANADQRPNGVETLHHSSSKTATHGHDHEDEHRGSQKSQDRGGIEWAKSWG